MRMHVIWSNGDRDCFEVAESDKDRFEEKYTRENIKDIDGRILLAGSPVFLSFRHARKVWFEE